MIKAKIRGTGGNSFRIETTILNSTPTSEQYIKDAKIICELLLGGIPSGTFDEIMIGIRYCRRKNIPTWSDEFQEHFEKRLKKLNGG